ncbi:carboxymethylenebutenolidase [Exophiala aquamarina CBS 119918]|uniref:Carboxymethylenebutenolidase n=1 Tax=Exophiala aquamarina CBS 119918 TaxID=1182545 RepID=A0A072PW28_9EURO|nr:carboxymethylenebutenolidase [Exophiala aquamarina CBS 119918]KEF63568.1 carboxymethylenebutenolidase [Exophiala aquamarina CBS 119918]
MSKYNDITQPPPPLPSSKLVELGEGLKLLSPLTRRGYGPGIILLTKDSDDPLAIREGVPSLLIKWAEEGYAVVGIEERALATGASASLKAATEALSKCEKCEPKGKVGLVAYDPILWNITTEFLAEVPEVVVAITYGDASDQKTLAQTQIPVLQQLAGGELATRQRTTDILSTYFYPDVQSYQFATPFSESFHYNTEALSHTRNLTFLKPIMGGPYFDLEYIWDEHTYYEFSDRSVEHTMSTMVQEPYVNHVPTMTGGVGRTALTSFYRQNFIFLNSADTSMELLSRTIGIDRIIDEFLFKFTHDKELDWFLPGIPPTFRKAEIPFHAVVNIRGDRLYHEHINWDQGTALRQLGLMPEYLPYPAQLVKGSEATPNKRYEYKVPVGGIEVASKMRDRNSVSSNEMFKFKVKEVDGPHL